MKETLVRYLLAFLGFLLSSLKDRLVSQKSIIKTKKVINVIT